MTMDDITKVLLFTIAVGLFLIYYMLKQMYDFFVSSNRKTTDVFKKTMKKASAELLLDEALDLIKSHDYVSPPLFQRTLSITYSRAEKLIRSLEDKGFIAKGRGEKPRKVYKSSRLN